MALLTILIMTPQITYNNYKLKGSIFFCNYYSSSGCLSASVSSAHGIFFPDSSCLREIDHRSISMFSRVCHEHGANFETEDELTES